MKIICKGAFEMTKDIKWPGWETVRLIGRGSFGAVYEIQRDVFGDIEKAALKVISIPQNDSDIEELYNDGYDDESITSRFQSHLKSIVAEYSLMRKLDGCANIVSCDDVQYVQHDDGIGWDIFIKMELLTPLTKSLPKAVSEEMVIRIGVDLCKALAVCKEHGIVHRDIKPQNIFVSKYGDYKLGDFGIAKTVEMTTGGTKAGTYKYMAPEVYNNQPYGSSADICSLGLVLYWLMNERRMPFLPLPPATVSLEEDTKARNRRMSGEQIPAPVYGSEELKRIILKACAYDPKDRYQSATEMLDALEKIGTSSPVVEGRGVLLNGEGSCNPKDEEIQNKKNSHETEAWKNETYHHALSLMEKDTVECYCSAIACFESISEWKDARHQISVCYGRIIEIEAKEERERLEQERKKEEPRGLSLEGKQKVTSVIVAAAIVAVMAIGFMVKSAVVSNEKYNEALALLGNGNDKEAAQIFEELGTYKDSKDYTEKIEKELLEQKVQETLEKINEYMEDNNYVEAIIYLDERASIVEDNKELQNKLNIIIEQYRLGVIAEAAHMYDLEGYTGAVAILEEALSILNDDSLLMEEKEKYEQCAPVSVLELDCLHQGDQVEVGAWNKDVYRDVNGKTYWDEGIHYLGKLTGWDNPDSCYMISYYLGQEYDFFVGVMYRPYISLAKDVQGQDTKLKIYGDDKLLFESSGIDSDSYDPVELKIDVTGVRKLTLELRGRWSQRIGGYWDGYTEYYPDYCLADLAVVKTP